MTVFKAVLKVLKKNIFIVILYTIIFLSFGTLNFKTNNTSNTFKQTKPSVVIINKDDNKGITKGFIKYVKKNSKIKKIENDEKSINDALFFGDVDYVIIIPKNFNNNFLQGNNPKLDIKTTPSYLSSLSEMIVQRYLDTANIYKDSYSGEELNKKINDVLNMDVKVKITSKVDVTELSNSTAYYNFASYSILAIIIYIISTILSSFREKNILKRTSVSSVNYKKHNMYLLLSNSIFSIAVWLLYVIISLFLVGKIMFTGYGLIYMINALILVFTTTAFAFFVGNLVTNKNVIGMVVNVVALASSFLCGAFVPAKFLPDFVLKIAHVFPTYYYISNNEMLTNMEKINIISLTPLFKNGLVMIIFMIVFIILSNIVVNKKRRIG